MPAATEARARSDGDALVFSGALDRDAVAALWPPALAAIGRVQRLDLGAVTAVDSAGLALLTELAARLDHAITLQGDPSGLAELRAAYRLSPRLAFEA
jgi:phospholipid transport system transporter-binding protein